MTNSDVNARVRKRRNALRKAGLRPVQIWVPDTRRPRFVDECRRQCRRVTAIDKSDRAMRRLLDETLAETEGWTG